MEVETVKLKTRSKFRLPEFEVVDTPVMWSVIAYCIFEYARTRSNIWWYVPTTVLITVFHIAYLISLSKKLFVTQVKRSDYWEIRLMHKLRRTCIKTGLHIRYRWVNSWLPFILPFLGVVLSDNLSLVFFIAQLYFLTIGWILGCSIGLDEDV